MKLRIIFLFSLIFPLFIISANAQKQTETPVDTVIVLVVQPYEITEIPAEAEKLNKEIDEIWKLIFNTASVAEIDSIMPLAEVYLDSVKMIFDGQAGTFTYRNLENYRAEWNNYSKRLETWKGTVSSRLTILNSDIIVLEQRIDRWRVTHQDLIDKESGEQLIELINPVIDSLGIVKKALSERIDFNVLLLNSISDKAVIVENAKKEINKYQLEIQAAYFYRDSHPIWGKGDPDDQPENIVPHVMRLFNENTRAINIFLTNNLSSTYFHIILIILLLIILNIIRRKIKQSNLISEDKEIQITKSILLNPWMVALFLGLLFGMLIYENRPIIFTEAIYLILLIPLFLLLPRIIPKNLMFFVRLMVVMIVIDEIQIFMDPVSFIRRLMLLLETFLAIWFFLSLWRFKKLNKEIIVSRIWRILINATPIFLFLLVISVFGNLFGYARLSNFLTNSIVSTVLITAVYFLLLVILKSIVMFGLRLYHKDYWHSESRINIEKRINRILNVLVSIIWIITILRIFNVYRLLIEWIDHIMEIEWVLGKASISLGGIISFLIILVITSVLATWIKKLFKSEFILRSKIPRGVPAAISMLTRYVIVAFGIYIALIAAGVDLGSFGLIAGALGVGIGFGLQNVVYNFISGLIISFERPIHVGDIIEVGVLMGEVTEIGVRSSKVMTYDGSEVIVPNGNLISNEVINWTLSNQIRRLKILIRTDYNADPQKVLSILREESAKYHNTLKEPEVMALFDGYGDSSLDFTLYFWVHFHVSFTSKSEVALNIYERLKSEGIGVPIPAQRWYYEHDGQQDHPPLKSGK